ncbi:hypothetical protein F1559_001584 [Cyanidiococcus yangmingshanensis]|uniref:Uncharacterized protein n=1 Tax=Cyanidiococcus yangmingshanensis TaxID=2690220 RepID=A0A7J7IHJ5_9RHOD|nr:hypothetical protein F1559_001584 [Cyanidiococcus yangmingshanensis]
MQHSRRSTVVLSTCASKDILGCWVLAFPCRNRNQWHDVWHAPPAEAAYSTSASSKVRVLRRNNSTLRLALAGSLFIDRLDVEGPQGRHSPAGEGVRDAVLYEYMDAAEFRKRQLLEMERARQSRELHLSDDVPIPEATSVSEDEDRDDQEYDRETTCSQAAGEEQVSDRTSVSGSSVAARVAPSPWTSLPPGAGLPVAPTIPRVFASNEDEYREQLLAASLLTSLDRRRSSGSRGYGRPANSIRSDSTSHTNESAEETRRTSAIISQSPPSESTEKVHPSTAHGHVSGVSSGSSAHSMPSATVQELSGSGRYRPGSNAAPSRFCHVCARTKDLQTCANLSSGCRKVTCAKCFEDHHWTRSDAWICTHCRGVCPERSQCQIYRLSNRNRNAKGRRGTHSGQGSGVGSGPRRKRGRLV